MVAVGARYGCVNVVEGVLGRGSGVDSAEAAYGGEVMALSVLIAGAFDRSRSRSTSWSMEDGCEANERACKSPCPCGTGGYEDGGGGSGSGAAVRVRACWADGAPAWTGGDCERRGGGDCAREVTIIGGGDCTRVGAAGVGALG